MIAIDNGERGEVLAEFWQSVGEAWGHVDHNLVPREEVIDKMTRSYLDIIQQDDAKGEAA